MKEALKLKNPHELMEMLASADGKQLESLRPILEYIDVLHDALKGYQVVIDTALQRNRDIQ